MPTPLTPGDHLRSVTVDGVTRSLLVHVPPSYDGTQPFPLVLAFHGGASYAQGMARFCGLDEKADEAGFIVGYPNGTGRLKRVLTWNAGICCGYARDHQVDDVEFVRAMLDDLSEALNLDQQRIYATGMSNGAMISYLLAAELSDRIAAIAPVAGPMATETCAPKYPVSVVHFHGTLDEFTPFAGGNGRRSVTGTHHFSVEHSIRSWVAANGCPPEPMTTELPTPIDDGLRLVRQTYGPGRGGAEVVLYIVEGGGHTWPGRRGIPFLLGHSTQNLIANDVIWDFFERHPRRPSA